MSNYRELGDVVALDAMEAELSKSAPVDLSETAQRQQEIEEAGGIAFPYDPVMAQAVTQIVGVGSGVCARKWGEHWNLTEDEANKLGVAMCQVVERYFPDLEPTTPIMNLAFVSATVVGPRIMVSAMSKGAAKSES